MERKIPFQRLEGYFLKTITFLNNVSIYPVSQITCTDYLIRVVVTLRNVWASKKVQLKFLFQIIQEIHHSNSCHGSQILTFDSKRSKLALQLGHIDLKSIVYTKMVRGTYICTKVEYGGKKTELIDFLNRSTQRYLKI